MPRSPHGSLPNGSLLRTLTTNPRLAFKPLTFWIAILAIMASLHSDVFEQDETPLKAMVLNLLYRLYSSIFSPYYSEQSLSSIIDKHYQKNQSSNKNMNPLYIFILDISKSMDDYTVFEDQSVAYVKTLKSIGYDLDILQTKRPKLAECIPKGGGKTNGFDIATSELCIYINELPLKSHAALWTFGQKLDKLVPSQDEITKRYITIERDESGSDNRHEFFQEINKVTARSNYTNFTKMLTHILHYYDDQINRKDGKIDEVHIVIISDFEHDVKNPNTPKQTSSFVQEIYISHETDVISKIISDMSKKMSYYTWQK